MIITLFVQLRIAKNNSAKFASFWHDVENDENNMP